MLVLFLHLFSLGGHKVEELERDKTWEWEKGEGKMWSYGWEEGVVGDIKKWARDT